MTSANEQRKEDKRRKYDTKYSLAICVPGGEIVSTFDCPLKIELGAAYVQCTIVLGGATQQIVDEADRSLHDALCVLSQSVKETRTVSGRGCSEMLMAEAMSKLAAKMPGRRQGGHHHGDLCQIFENAARYNFRQHIDEREVGDVAALGKTESFQVKNRILLCGTEAAQMIRCVYNIIRAAPQ
ncbi:hypothetical protein BaRGS_00017423 [Batillaria attramentaria]|uniref:Uncharacterized protein n=1 Tax=Batillaria attramentaria TaxID=370345 RepID=A0ABD0KX45_9CAEN